MEKKLYIAHKKPPALVRTTESNRVVEGIAKTGEVSPLGTVAHTERHNGRISADVNRSTLRLVMDGSGQIRPMTMPEMIERGYFVPGKGPR